MKTPEAVFEQIRETARKSEDILGFVLTGSRGKGFENQWSDYDFAIFVKDDALEKYQSRYDDTPFGVHLYIFTLDSFSDYASWNTEGIWDRYTWAHLKVEFDRTRGKLQTILDEKGRVPKEHVEAYIDFSLRWFINQVYHSLKCLRVDNRVGYRFEAAEAIRPYLQAVFCLHDRRVVPFYKYLGWELEKYPLSKLGFSSRELLEAFYLLLETGDYQIQQKLLREAKHVFMAEGYTKAFDAWQGSLDEMLSFSLVF